jgi:hypothetical protein
MGKRPACGVTDMTMKEIYYQCFPGKLIFFTITTCFLSWGLFSIWKNSGSWLYLIFANLLLLVSIICTKPLIEWRRIEIENGHIIIFKRFFKPLKINISDSLYEVVIKDKDIRSFRFRCGNYFTQVSPILYKNGDEMAKTILDYIDKYKINVEVVTARI